MYDTFQKCQWCLNHAVGNLYVHTSCMDAVQLPEDGIMMPKVQCTTLMLWVLTFWACHFNTTVSTFCDWLWPIRMVSHGWWVCFPQSRCYASHCQPS